MRNSAWGPFLSHALLAGSQPVSAAPVPAAQNHVGAASVPLHRSHIESEAGAEVVRPGRDDQSSVKMTVTRPNDTDPSGSGQPMPPVDPEPAADVNVGIAFMLGSTYTWDTGITDADGKATLHVPIPKDSDTGWVTAYGSAEKTHFTNNSCPDVKELGFREFPRFVKITP